MNALDLQTVMVDAYESVCDPATDVVWQFVTLPPGVLGTYHCASFSSSGVCNRGIVRNDPAQTRPSMARHRANACHELGHSVGLRHGNSNDYQCMRSGFPPDDSLYYRNFQPHHVWHIDNHY